MLFFASEIIQKPGAPDRRGLGEHPQRSALCPKASAGRGKPVSGRFPNGKASFLPALDDFPAEILQGSRECCFSLRKSSSSRLPLPGEALGSTHSEAPSARKLRQAGASRSLDDFLREKRHSYQLWMISRRKSSKARGNVVFLLGNHPETGCP